jgi:hypothetical protein
MLAADPESLEGLSLTGVLSKGLANCLTGFCGTEEELEGVPDHQDYERISDVLRAGREVVRNRWAMGRVRWAEWLAFMQSRGLEWASRSLTRLPTLRHGGVLRQLKPAPSRWITYMAAS